MNILVRVKIEEDISLRMSLRIRPTIEALTMGMDGTVVEANNCWRKREKRNGREEGLSMLENGLGLRLRYSEAL